VRCLGKGRKTRCTPLRKDTVAALKAWQQEQQGRLEAPVFPNAWGQALESRRSRAQPHHLKISQAHRYP